LSTTAFGFPFRIDPQGRVASQSGNDNIRAKIMQILLTSPGERVMLPEFGCGLLSLVFDPNNQILAAVTEFTIRKALEAWAGNEIIVESVDASSNDETIEIEVTYFSRDQLQRGKVKIAF
jgi:Bacteriophage baseplate protein W